ncbi:MAG: hypothetical protein QXR48_01320 [Candidatus Woesearchaeota archaeon]
MKIKQLITTPRIIGIALIIIAVLTYIMQQSLEALIIAIPGLILLLTPNKSAKEEFKEFINSFKLNKEYAWIMFIDAMCWVVCALLFFGLYALLKNSIEKLRTLPIGTSLNPAMLSAYNDILQRFFINAIIALVVFYLLALIAYSVSRGMIWNVLLTKRTRTQFFLRLGLLNLIWCTIWVFITGFFLVTMKSPLAIIALFAITVLLYVHLTTILHHSFTKNNAFGAALKDTFGTGVGSLARFAHPYCYIFIIYVLLSWILSIAQGKMQMMMYFVLLFAFMAWYRIYMRNTLRRIL